MSKIEKSRQGSVNMLFVSIEINTRRNAGMLNSAKEVGKGPLCLP